MATANDVLKRAAKEIGYTRWNDPQQGTIYGRWYAKKLNSPWFGTNGVPYCAMFVSYILDQVGQQVAGCPTASCTSLLNAARKAGLVISNKKNAKAGDIVIFDWDPSKGNGVDHVGFVELNKGSYIQTIEGNTSSGNSGSQGNGGGVYRRTRNWSVVSAVIRPKYSGTAASTPTPPPAQKPSAGAKLEVDGYVGVASTKEWQRQLGCSSIDGVISSQMVANKKYTPNLTSIQRNNGDGSLMVVNLQRFLINKGYSCGGYGADGHLGKDTVIAIQKWMRNSVGYKKHTIDGIIGPDTAANIQNALNAGAFKK